MFNNRERPVVNFFEFFYVVWGLDVCFSRIPFFFHLCLIIAHFFDCAFFFFFVILYFAHSHAIFF